MPEKLHIRKDTASLTDSGKACPACQRTIPSDSVLCTHCGFDFAQGRRIKVAARRKPFRARPALVLLALAAAAAAGFYYRAPVQGGLRQAAEWGARWLTAEDRRVLEVQLQTELPLFVVGAPAEIRMLKGTTVKGIFLGLQDDQIQLRVRDGEVGIPLPQVSHSTRLRCDVRERNRHVDRQLQQLLDRRTDAWSRVARQLKAWQTPSDGAVNP
jgi:hypothetical protein